MVNLLIANGAKTASAGLIDHHLSTRPTVELIWIALRAMSWINSLYLYTPEAYRYIDLLSAAFGWSITTSRHTGPCIHRG